MLILGKKNKGISVQRVKQLYSSVPQSWLVSWHFIACECLYRLKSKKCRYCNNYKKFDRSSSNCGKKNKVNVSGQRPFWERKKTNRKEVGVGMDRTKGRVRPELLCCRVAETI